MQSLVSTSLSDEQIMRLVEGEANLVTHEKIREYSSIEDLLGPHQACIILYVTNATNQIYGHWCCVYKAPDGSINFFDPYGKAPDFTLSKMKHSGIQQFGNEPALVPLLGDFIDRGGHVTYSKYPLQKKSKYITNCGRLTGLRLQFRHLSNKDFNDLMHSYKSICPDQLSTIMTSFIT